MFGPAVARWADEHVGELWVDRDPEGRPVVERAAPIIAIKVDWFLSHGWADVFSDDHRTITFAEDARYGWVRDLPDGRTAYERLP